MPVGPARLHRLSLGAVHGPDNLLAELRDVISWLIRKFDERVDRIVRDRLNKTRVTFRDPLAVYGEQEDVIHHQLRLAVNRVGRHVMVGNGVTLWGGRGDTVRGIELHDNVRLFDYCTLVVDHLSADSGIVLEAGVAINFRCYVDGSGGVHIGQRSILGPNVVIVSSGHRVDAETPIQSSGKELGRVDIGADVWIGANVVILKNVHIGDRAVIGAGAVVTRNVPADAVAVGNPARVVRNKIG